MKFEYELTGVGWAEGCIEINSAIAYFEASYITDALYDMLKAVSSLVPEVSPYPVSMAQFEWNEEPGGTVWTLSKIALISLHVQIKSYQDLRSKRNEIIALDETCTIHEFISTITQTLDMLLRKYGREGYKEKWVNFDFPMDLYLKLKSFTAKND